jgi:hypothetical protein
MSKQESVRGSYTAMNRSPIHQTYPQEMCQDGSLQEDTSGWQDGDLGRTYRQVELYEHVEDSIDGKLRAEHPPQSIFDCIASFSIQVLSADKVPCRQLQCLKPQDAKVQ